MEPGVKGKVNIGYTFFENSVLSPQSIENAQRDFDVVVAGSSWCENILREHGLKNTRSILQGVDRGIFNACENQKTVFNDKFVIFSGGKLEFRKGQDLVIRAFKALQDKYDDILLVNAWFNPWESSLQTMATSPYIDFTLESRDYFKAIEKLLSANGIDAGKVITLPPKANVAMARIYKNSDCGLFPNRCEGGTNLVLMEYMACGKPAIVSNSSGHRDVANEHNAIMLNSMKQVVVSQDEKVVAVWDDPDLDEVIDKLEWAYNNRESLLAVGEAAGRSMERFTWESAAKKFYQLAVGI
jgi:glycosyltransferase involved in cell wall biosynthesis